MSLGRTATPALWIISIEAQSQEKTRDTGSPFILQGISPDLMALVRADYPDSRSSLRTNLSHWSPWPSRPTEERWSREMMNCPNFEQCEGLLTFRIYRDGDGDPNVTGGTRTWTAAECTDQTCACEFDNETWQKLEAEAIEASANAEPWGID
jgi:hypothetical protein